MKKLNLGKIRKKLPRTPGIMRRNEYFNSAVLIPLIKMNDEYHFLFEKRAENIRQGGEICFPGGEFDPESDNNFKNTAVRETIEELGIKKSKIKVIGEIDTFVGPMGVTVNSFLAELKLKNIKELKIDKTEVEKVFTVPVSFFIKNEPEIYQVRMVAHSSFVDEKGITVNLFPVKELNLPERYHSPWENRRQKVLVYRIENEVLWGITAVLVHEVCKLLISDK